MADRPSNDLLHRSLAASQTSRIIFRGKVAHQGRDTVAGMKKRQRSLQESGLARARAGNETYGQHTRFAEALTQRASDYVVLFEDILPNFHQARFGAHSLISSATTSSSFPRRTVGVGVPHSGQQNHWIEETSRGASHLGQKTSTGISSIKSCEPSRGVATHAIS